MAPFIPHRIKGCLQNVGVPKVKLTPKCLSLEDSTFVFIILWDIYFKYLVKVHVCYLVEITQ